MTLGEIRERIDAIDGQIKALFLARMSVAHDVATVKNEAGETNIYRADREISMIERLTADVPDELKAEYAAFIRKTTEVSRMYQYGLLCDWNPEYLELPIQGIRTKETDTCVVIRITRPDVNNSMSAVLCMVGDYGFQMQQMILLSTDKDKKTVSFELTIEGNLNDIQMKKLLFQLSKESIDFCVLKTM